MSASAPLRSRKGAKFDHPFQQGASFAKTDIRRIARLPSDERAKLVNIMWVDKALKGQTAERPNDGTLSRRQPKAMPALMCPKPSVSAPETKTPRITFDQLPTGVRRLVYQYCCLKAERSPTSPLLTPDALRRESRLPSLSEAFPTLATEMLALMSTMFRGTTFEFDLRKPNNGFLRWTKHYPTEAKATRKLKLRHWTCWINLSECTWSNAAGETTLEMEPSGMVKIINTSTTRDSSSCSCEMADLLDRRCPGWNVNKAWSLRDFANALRRDESVLIQAALEFICLFNQSGIQRASPHCEACGLGRIHFRTHKQEGRNPTSIKMAQPVLISIPKLAPPIQDAVSNEHSPCSEWSPRSGYSSNCSPQSYYSTHSGRSPTIEHSPCSEPETPAKRMPGAFTASVEISTARQVKVTSVKELPSRQRCDSVASNNLKRSSALRRPDTLPRSSTEPASFPPHTQPPPASTKSRKVPYELEQMPPGTPVVQAPPQSYIAPKISFLGRTSSPSTPVEERPSPSSVRAVYTQLPARRLPDLPPRKLPDLPPAASARPVLRLVTPYVQSFSDFKRLQDQWRAAEQRRASEC
ncbi:uncharacterized protein MYCGRDRAFT_107719 [Zymoseptoria tritici IPO323]|uniref:Uncharacterized protein n=1 Tax=Zymoseptoria tritici (strain CBS 115943 / IPO323) TaxID=336722 RepID=F9X0S2_ZYMTI|nr:uncharacterized protein MYCGRDRAFT_107719 [Zymoseptoria tritici IPO323]EGP91728.1 hypothetical protein MYCGRDRAFT_107719 [Zymoseptoria tritici IPO323]